MAVYLVVAKAVGAAERNDLLTVSVAKVAWRGLEMVIPFHSVGQGLAAFPAPDHTLLLVFEVVIEMFVSVIERLATRYTPEHKLLGAEIMIRLGTLSVARFHLLSSPMTVGGMNVFELSREFVIIHYLVDGFLFGNNGWSRLLFTSAITKIPLFGNVLQVSELPLEVLFLQRWDRDAVGFTRFSGFGIARRGWRHSRM